MANVAQKLGAEAPDEECSIGDDEDRVAHGHVDRRRAGVLAHALIAALLSEGERAPTPTRISASAARLPGLADVRSYRMAVQQRVVTAAAVYFRLFMPAVGWTFDGSELRGPSARFDLVWRSAEGMFVDEVKSGRVATRRDLAAVREQAGRETQAGAAAFGERFLGVRVVSLGAPRTSFFADRDGRCTPLAWGS